MFAAYGCWGTSGPVLWREAWVMKCRHVPQWLAGQTSMQMSRRMGDQLKDEAQTLRNSKERP